MMKQPNVLLITIDSLRADHVYKSMVDTSVFNDLSADGVIYTNAFAQGPFTTFSMPSLFTSRYPSSLQYVEFSDKTIGVDIGESPTLPEVLSEHEYQTAGFHSNPLLSNLFGFDRGFDVFDAQLPFSNTDILPGRAKILTDKLLRVLRKHAYVPAETLTERAINWLDTRSKSGPFFLWLHYMDVHGPYQSKEGNTYVNKYRGERLWRKAQKQPEELSDAEQKRIKRLYREEIEYTDRHIGELVNYLKAHGLYEDTITVLTADHGELFGEYGQYSHPHLLHDELTHVPLIVRDPAATAKRVDNVVELIDVAPTLIERVGGTVPDSFVGTRLKETKENTEAAAISEADLVPSYHGSIRTAEYRYIRDQNNKSEELWHLSGDKQAQVTETDRDAVEAHRELLNRHLSDDSRAVGKNRDIREQDISSTDVQDRLEQLGYLE